MENSVSIKLLYIFAHSILFFFCFLNNCATLKSSSFNSTIQVYFLIVPFIGARIVGVYLCTCLLRINPFEMGFIHSLCVPSKINYCIEFHENVNKFPMSSLFFLCAPFYYKTVVCRKKLLKFLFFFFFIF